MLKNYFKITFRNLVKNKVSTIINLLGLSLGISSCLVVFLIISYELDFDSFHSKKDRIYRVIREEITGSDIDASPSVPFPLHEALLNDFPELESVTQVFNPEEYQLTHGSDRWNEEDIIFADSSFFKVFDFELVSGNKDEVLKNPGSLVISESVAAAHFGNDSPIGKTVRMQDSVEFEITGVFKKLPGNSHLPFNVIAPVQSFNAGFIGGFQYDNWSTTMGFYNYIVLPETESQASFDDKLKSLPAKYLSEKAAKETRFYLQPLREIHLDPQYANANPGYTIDTTYLWVLGCVGFFILILACINFINLSTAVATRKSKEVGVRKVMGASRSQLVKQFFGEAFCITLLAILLAMGVTELIVPMLNNFLGVSLELNVLNNTVLMMFILGTLVFVSVSSGVYPSWVLSGYKPVQALKNKITSHSDASAFLRKGLVTFQFIISQVLIIGTIVMASQMNYFRNKPLGFDKDFIVVSNISNNDPVVLETLKNQLLTNAAIQNVSFAVGVPTSPNDIGSSIKLEGSDNDYSARIKAVDYDYKETFGLELVAGNWFTRKEQNTKGEEYLINETAMKQWGFSSPEEAIGEHIAFGMNKESNPIIGVVKDFHIKSLESAIEPVIILQHPDLYFEAGVRISSANIPSTIDFIKDKWEQAFPEYIFEYEFLDENLEENYSREQKIYTLAKIFSGISIGIGCLGLFGLISFLVVQKTKEVGVRKVLGATVYNIVLLFSSNFMHLLVIAFVIAVPLSWYAMTEWLSGFAYRIDLHWKYFIWGGLINLFIAFFTISYQSVKAAMANPVDSLRDE